MSCEKPCTTKYKVNGKYRTPQYYGKADLYGRFNICICFIEVDFELVFNNVANTYTTQCTGFFLNDFLVAPASHFYLPSVGDIESSETPKAIRVYTRAPKYVTRNPLYAEVIAMDVKSNIALLLLPQININKIKQFKLYNPNFQSDTIYNNGELVMYYYNYPQGCLDIINTTIRKCQTSLLDLDHPLVTLTNLNEVPQQPWTIGTPIINVYGMVCSMVDPTLNPQGCIDRQCFYTLFSKLVQGFLFNQGYFLSIWGYIGIRFSKELSSESSLYIEESENPEVPANSNLFRLSNEEKTAPTNVLSSPGIFLFNSQPGNMISINNYITITLDYPPIQQQNFGWAIDKIFYVNGSSYQTLRQLYLSIDPSVAPELDNQVRLSRSI